MLHKTGVHCISAKKRIPLEKNHSFYCLNLSIAVHPPPSIIVILWMHRQFGSDNMHYIQHRLLSSFVLLLFVGGEVALSASEDLIQSITSETTSCSLYLAESTIPNAGMGVFTAVVSSLYIFHCISFTLYQSTNKPICKSHTFSL